MTCILHDAAGVAQGPGLWQIEAYARKVHLTRLLDYAVSDYVHHGWPQQWGERLFLFVFSRLALYNCLV